MGHSYQFDDGGCVLVFRRLDAECNLLQRCYTGIRFNQVQLNFPPPNILALDPTREDMEALFNVSGSAESLERHGFGHPAWWRMLPESGISHRCATKGFGRAWHTIRTGNGYRLQGACYDDDLSKLAKALFPFTWTSLGNRPASGGSRSGSQRPRDGSGVSPSQ